MLRGLLTTRAEDLQGCGWLWLAVGAALGCSIGVTAFPDDDRYDETMTMRRAYVHNHVETDTSNPNNPWSWRFAEAAYEDDKKKVDWLELRITGNSGRRRLSASTVQVFQTLEDRDLYIRR